MLSASFLPRICPVRISCSSAEPPINQLNPVFDHFPLSNASINHPTAPWMKDSLLLPPNELLNQHRNKRRSGTRESEKLDRSLTGKECGVRGKKALRNVVRGLQKLGVNRKSDSSMEDSAGLQLLDGENMKKLLPWERNQEVDVLTMKRYKVRKKEDCFIDKIKLKTLREEARKMKTWVKVKKAGITQDIVDQIYCAWKKNELAMVKFDVPLCRSMSRAKELLEMKTNGVVVWSRNDVHVIYNSVNEAGIKNAADVENDCERSLFDRETDRLLDSLGPRFADWWMKKPLPVDADMLPEVVEGFLSPRRLSLPQDTSKLRDDELTYLRKLASGLPTHFVVGRNRRLQGLAAAILKLWRKSLIAKIAIKWGIPNTDNEQMANELKLLTGGTLLLRNKFYIIIYRGNDFVIDQVANMVEERECLVNEFHIKEEIARGKSMVDQLYITEEPHVASLMVGTLSEYDDLQARFVNFAKGIGEADFGLEAQVQTLERKLRIAEHSLSIIKRKIEVSERELAKLESEWQPSERDLDYEIMTEEQRKCYREIGLKMQSCLVLGRRGIFEGIMEGLHQHWRHKEVTKVITMQKNLSQVAVTAKLLEAESAGIVVSIDKLKKGHAIIIYRGKNYRRPIVVSNGNLLTKRKALCRSLLLQKIGSLKFYANQRVYTISLLKSELENLQQPSADS